MYRRQIWELVRRPSRINRRMSLQVPGSCKLLPTSTDLKESRSILKKGWKSARQGIGHGFSSMREQSLQASKRTWFNNAWQKFRLIRYIRRSMLSHLLQCLPYPSRISTCLTLHWSVHRTIMLPAKECLWAWKTLKASPTSHNIHSFSCFVSPYAHRCGGWKILSCYVLYSYAEYRSNVVVS